MFPVSYTHLNVNNGEASHESLRTDYCPLKSKNEKEKKNTFQTKHRRCNEVNQMKQKHKDIYRND